MKNTNLCI